MAKKPTALGVYIFAGGFTLGVRRYFRVLAHLEGNRHGVNTARKNFPWLPVHVGYDDWPVDAHRGVDFVYANPPCAPWSVAAGFRHSSRPWREDPRLECVEQTFTLLERLRPRVWAWESVRPALTRGRELVDELTDRAHRLGYSATYLYVDGERHGVPQRRKRLFVLFHDVTLDFPLPRSSRRLVHDVLEDPRVRPKTYPFITNETVRRLLPAVRPGELVRAVWDRRYRKRVRDAATRGDRVRGRPNFQMRRVRRDDVAGTMTGGAQFLHPEEDRYLSVEECAALCGYPPGFEFTGAISRRYAEVAQAVMPPVAAYLARHVARGIRRGEPTRGTTTFVDVSCDERIVEPWGERVPLEGLLNRPTEGEL